MRKVFFRKLLTAMCITLGACLLLYPLLLPTENYFRLVLQLFPVAFITGVLLLIPLYLICERFSRSVTAELKTLKLDSRQAISDYPELRPVARQIMSFRMQMEAQKNELEGQQEQLKVLTDNMQEGLLLVSATGRVLSHNHAALQLLDKESMSGDFDVFDLNDKPVFRDLVNNALAGVRGSAVITVNDTACQLFANPVTRGSMMTGAVLVLLDVTEREKRDALRREFTSNVSHELKTPLTSIYGIADMMESGMVKTEDISGFVSDVDSFQIADRACFRAFHIVMPQLALGKACRIPFHPAQKNRCFFPGQQVLKLRRHFFQGMIRPQFTSQFSYGVHIRNCGTVHRACGFRRPDFLPGNALPAVRFQICRGKLIRIRVSRGLQPCLFIFLQILPQDPVKPVRALPQIPGIIYRKDIIRSDIGLTADILQHLIQAFQAHEGQMPVAAFRRPRHLPVPVGEHFLIGS